MSTIKPLRVDPSGWIASEKYDGVMAIIDGGIVRSRHGRRMAAPSWYTDELPDLRLVGELWIARGAFSRLQSAISTRGSTWHEVELHIFDVAAPEPYSERMAALRRLTLPPHIKIVDSTTIRDRQHLDGMETAIVRGGGEGVMLRRPDSPFRPGYAGDIIKVKRMHPDLDRWQG